MVLPTWAERAFEKHRPRGAGNDEPDPERLEWWEGCKQRFVQHWADLDAKSWRVPDEHSCYVALRRNVIVEPPDFVRMCILETVLDLAWDHSVGDSPDRVTPAVKELESLNAKIASKAGELASLFRQRDQLRFDNGVEDYETDYAALDAFDLWDALELTINLPHVARWAYVAQHETARFLNIARSQSRTKPRWPDLLDQVAGRSVRAAAPSDAGDIAVHASRTNATEWSRWGRRLLGTLDDWSGTFPRGFLRGCLTGAHLACLLEVALDAPPEAFNKRQMERLAESYDRRNKS
ncbi:MAG: hypothetical protein NDI95_05665 [Acidovorax soli]|uniref:hypothetical protein n=1 Tax=Acidovorax soli TaxID=592050 RepID=UPI0026F0ABC3|nr:hypothetical protein [Acidovorax soli]MCM2346120.1 hypothetical protein [Acidovorax soli]